MKKYETVFIVSAKAAENELKEINEKLVRVAKQNEGQILNCQTIGRKSLAFPMKKQFDGIYYHMEYEGNKTVVSEIESSLRFDDRVLRFLTTAL